MFYHGWWDGNIGGPMALGEEYRWNMPIITYGFDKSFLDYFGRPGVDAVEAAIQVINDLPPASGNLLTIIRSTQLVSTMPLRHKTLWI